MRIYTIIYIFKVFIVRKSKDVYIYAPYWISEAIMEDFKRVVSDMEHYCTYIITFVTSELPIFSLITCQKMFSRFIFRKSDFPRFLPKQ